jgi:hypothetical protein
MLHLFTHKNNDHTLSPWLGSFESLSDCIDLMQYKAKAPSDERVGIEFFDGSGSVMVAHCNGVYFTILESKS